MYYADEGGTFHVAGAVDHAPIGDAELLLELPDYIEGADLCECLA